MSRTVLIAVSLATLASAQDTPKLYNSAKAKLAAGEPIPGAKFFSLDPNIYLRGGELGL